MVIALLALFPFVGTPAQEVSERKEPRTLEFVLIDQEKRPVPGIAVRWLSYDRVQEERGARGEYVQRWEWQDLVEKDGLTVVTDGAGRGSLESPGGTIYLSARLGELYAFTFAGEEDPSPVEVRLGADRRVRILTRDARGQPRSGVPVVLYRTLGRDFVEWIGSSGADGLATLEHAQTFLAPREEIYNGVPRLKKPRLELALGVPVREQRRIHLRPDTSPEEPIVLEMPPTGSIQLVATGAEGCWAGIRTAPAPGADLLRAFWSGYEPPRARVEGGRAWFPFVEVGLRLQCEVRCDAWAEGTQWIAEGPIAEGETATIDFGDRAPPRLQPNQASLLENNERVAVRWASLCASTAANDRFVLCFVPVDDRDLRNRRFVLQLADRMPHGSGWHTVEGLECGHECVELDPGDKDIVSKSLGIPISKRGPRPYRLEASFRADRPRYPPGSDVLVTVELTNRGTTPVLFEAGGWERLANRHARFRFEVERDGTKLPDIDRTENCGGLSTVESIRPGESMQEGANASQWAPFDRAGTYDITATYELHLEGTPWPFEGGQGCPYWLENYVDEYTSVPSPKYRQQSAALNRRWRRCASSEYCSEYASSARLASDDPSRRLVGATSGKEH